MKRQGGFTLIELVVVIVILGILAVTAAPRFLNLQGDARAASLQGLKGAMDGASGIVYGKSAIEGIETSAAASTQDGIDVVWGYPAATTDGIGESVVGLSSDWLSATGTSGALNTLVSTFKNSSLSDYDDITGTGCYVYYSEATSSAVYSTGVVDTGCN